TVQNLVLLEINAEDNVLLVQGAVPGARNGYVIVRNAKKKAGIKVKLRTGAETQEKSKNPMKASKAAAGGAKGGGAAKPENKERGGSSPAGGAMSKLRDKSHRHDVFHRRAKQQGFAARSVFKLEEIDHKLKLFRPGARVLDLGCRPGSWLQYAAQKV